MKRTDPPTGSRGPKGKVLVALALALPAVAALAALAISLAYLQQTHSQLSAVVEAAASASIDTYNTTRNTDLAREAAKRVASRNHVQRQPLLLEDEDIEFGRYENRGDTWEFSSNSRTPNAVRIMGKVVDDGRSGPARFVKLLKTERSVELSRTTIATQLDRDLALVLDRSSAGAFAEDEVLPPLPGDLPLPTFTPPNWNWCLPVPLQSRFRNVMRSVYVFIVELVWTSPREQLALVSFADEATTDAALTLDYTLIVSELRRLASEYCGGASNKEEAIDQGVAAVTDPATSRPDAVKVLVLISDSSHDEGDPVAAARDADRKGIVVHTIGYGPNVDQVLMGDIAAAAGGTHFRATTGADVSRALREIARSLPTAIITDL